MQECDIRFTDGLDDQVPREKLHGYVTTSPTSQFLNFGAKRPAARPLEDVCMLKKRQKKKPQRDGLYPQGLHTYFPWESGDSPGTLWQWQIRSSPPPTAGLLSPLCRVSSGSDL